MRFTKTLIAVAALSAGYAMAATPVARIGISSGASASKNNLKIALTARCSGQLAEFTDGTANISTYVCAPANSFVNANAPTVAEYNAAGAVNFTGTVIAELRLNVNGGSFTAVCQLAGWPSLTACPAPDNYLDPSVGAVAAPPAGSVTIGGLMDVEPTAFIGPVRAGITLPAGTVTASASFGQAFGVAVSPALYNAMFADQQAAGLIPASPTCSVTLTNVPACVPSIGKAQMATVMANNSSNAFYSNGASFLAPSQLASGTAVTYARRVDTSGTQASAQQYFLGNVCNSSGSIDVVGAGQTLGPVTVSNLATTGNVRTLLNSSSAYVIGIISAENNQGAQSWRWLRVGGMQVAENAAPGTAGQSNTVTTLPGYYDYWFLSRIVRPNNTTAANFWTGVVTGLGTVPAGNTPGLFRTSETTFSKGTLTSCQTLQSN